MKEGCHSEWAEVDVKLGGGGGESMLKRHIHILRG